MNRLVVRSIASLAVTLCMSITCTAQVPCIVDLKYPNGGDTLKILDVVTIRFTTSSLRGVRLYLAKGSGEHRMILGTIASYAPAVQGHYDWTVGQYSGSGGKTIAVAGDDYSILAVAIGGVCQDASGPFTISPRIDVRSPNGGEQWLMSSVHGIRIDYFDGRSCSTADPWSWSMPVTVDLTLLTRDGRALDIDHEYFSTIECVPFSYWLRPGLTYSWSVGSLYQFYLDHGDAGFKIRARVTRFAAYPNEPQVLEDESDGTFSICDFLSGGFCGFIHIVPGE